MVPFNKFRPEHVLLVRQDARRWVNDGVLLTAMAFDLRSAIDDLNFICRNEPGIVFQEDTIIIRKSAVFLICWRLIHSR
ncbi:hypothetical protein ACFOGG_03500 [Brenneria rubrifaciens]|uniref:hypothetical protein n=1 Tax=Brenneria rubrifaciens TaxID=55213 RepID=UPI0036208C0A